MRGRWAAGIVPRNFTWVIEDRLAVSERPGGYAPHHRKVRRQEEILWINAQRFSRVVSLLPSTHNLHAYEERNLPSAHFPLPIHGDVSEVLSELYPALLRWLRAGDRVLMHQEELGERVAGVVAGFLCWCGVLPEPPRAISAVEQLFKRQMGAAGRSIVATAAALPPPGEPVLFVRGEMEVGVVAEASPPAAPDESAVPVRPNAGAKRRGIAATGSDDAAAPPVSPDRPANPARSTGPRAKSVASTDPDPAARRPVGNRSAAAVDRPTKPTRSTSAVPKAEPAPRRVPTRRVEPPPEHR